MVINNEHNVIVEGTQENSKQKPIITAIVSTYCSEKFIKGKIEDLVNQSVFPLTEIIIINSGSSENEELIIQEYLKKYNNIKYLKTEQRETIYKAWNRGIRVAKGEFITNANTDDRLKKNAYEVLSSILQKNPDVGLVYADQYLTQIENQTFEQAKANKNMVVKFPDYSHIKQLDRCIIGSQPMWRTSLHFVNNIWFNEEYEVCGDHEFELKVSEQFQIYHIRNVYGTFYKSPLRANKEYENAERNIKELSKIRKLYIPRYLEKISSVDLIKLKGKFLKKIIFPIPIHSASIKFVEKYLTKYYYRSILFHSIDFLYLFSIRISEKCNDLQKASRLKRRYLSYKKVTSQIKKYLKIPG
jgi:glycosyltransferase involved in cell wall biosynthesis